MEGVVEGAIAVPMQIVLCSLVAIVGRTEHDGSNFAIYHQAVDGSIERTVQRYGHLMVGG